MKIELYGGLTHKKTPIVIITCLIYPVPRSFILQMQHLKKYENLQK